MIHHETNHDDDMTLPHGIGSTYRNCPECGTPFPGGAHSANCANGKRRKRNSAPSRFDANWQDAAMPLLTYGVPGSPRQLAVMQSTIDRVLPLAISQPVAVVFRHDSCTRPGWTFTGTPMHDTIRAKVETLASAVADAVLSVPA